MTSENRSARPRRGRTQDVAVLVTASLLGVWLGATAPDTSPVAPPAASPATLSPAGTPAGRPR
jgi:hypothetical protein